MACMKLCEMDEKENKARGTSNETLKTIRLVFFYDSKWIFRHVINVSIKLIIQYSAPVS